MARFGRVLGSFAGTLPVPSHVGRVLVRLLMNDRHTDDQDDGQQDDAAGKTPAAIGLGRNVSIGEDSHARQYKSAWGVKGAVRRWNGGTVERWNGGKVERLKAQNA